MQMFQSTLHRQQYIEADIAGRGGGTIEDAAKRLTISPERVMELIKSGDLDALAVRLHDGSLDIIVSDAYIQSYGSDRRPRAQRGTP